MNVLFVRKKGFTRVKQGNMAGYPREGPASFYDRVQGAGGLFDGGEDLTDHA